MSGQVETVVIHDFCPGSNEVFYELLFRIRARIDFGNRAKLGVRPKDQIDAGCRPLEFVRFAIAAFVDLLWTVGTSRRLPYGTHIEKVDEEIVGQCFRTMRENAVRRPGMIGAE